MIWSLIQRIFMVSVVTGSIKALDKGTNCSLSSQCEYNLQCMANVCDCDSSTGKWDGSHCQMSFGRSCLQPIHCRSDQTLTCLAGKCGCIDTLYWDSNVISCQQKKVRTGTCTTTDHCSANLQCNGDVCDCLTGEQYWDGSTCLSKKSNGDVCASDEECLSDQTCHDNICTCNATTEFWDENKCAPKRTFLASCQSDDVCISDLACISDSCNCDISHFWNNIACISKLFRNQVCSSDNQCMSNLQCLNGECDCNSTSQYWDQNICEQRGSKGSICLSVFLGECQDNMICKDGICQCTGKWINETNQCSAGSEIAHESDDGNIIKIISVVLTVVCVILVVILAIFLWRRYRGKTDLFRGLSRKENSYVQHYENAAFRYNHETNGSSVENGHHSQDNANQGVNDRATTPQENDSHIPPREDGRDMYESLSHSNRERQYQALQFAHKDVAGVATESNYANLDASAIVQRTSVASNKDAGTILDVKPKAPNAQGSLHIYANV